MYLGEVMLYTLGGPPIYKPPFKSQKFFLELVYASRLTVLRPHKTLWSLENIEKGKNEHCAFWEGNVSGSTLFLNLHIKSVIVIEIEIKLPF